MWPDLQDAGIAELRVSDDAGLPARKGDGFAAQGLQGMREHHRRDDLTAGHHHIHLARSRPNLRIDVLEHFDQGIGCIGRAGAPYGGDDDHGAVSRHAGLDHLARGESAMFRAVHRGAAELLHQDVHAAASVKLVLITASGSR